MEGIKLSFFADDMILCGENPKDSTKNLLAAISEVSEVAGYKTDIQKTAALVHADGGAPERGRKRRPTFAPHRKP